MSVTTRADDALKEAKQKIQEGRVALQEGRALLLEAVHPETWGANEYRREHKYQQLGKVDQLDEVLRTLTRMELEL